jgi:hypothetical protein
MTLSPADAAAALQDSATVEQRSARLRGYQSASPHLIIWGVIWAIGYTGSYLEPTWNNAQWIGLVVLGIAADIAASAKDGRHQIAAEAMITLGITFFAFVAGTFAIMAPHDPRQPAAFFPLVVAAGYGILGAMGATRLLVIAAAIAVATMGGFFLLADLFLPFMAVVGGGGLILGGLWLRHI